MNKTIAGVYEQYGCGKIHIGFVHLSLCLVGRRVFASAFTPMLSKGVYALALFSLGLSIS